MNVNVNGIKLFYEISGAGSSLLFLHGNGEDHHIFDELAAKLKNDFTVYALDSRNHGLSTKTDCYSYEVMAEDVYCFINELNLSDVSIVGFSDGAIIALMLALKHPETLRKMALLGVNLKPSDFTEESLKFVKDTYEQTKDPLFKLMLEQPDIELNELKKIKTPSLIIAAENDIYKPETFTNIASMLPNSRLQIMKDHEHDSYIAHKDILYHDLLKFFKD